MSIISVHCFFLLYFCHYYNATKPKPVLPSEECPENILTDLLLMKHPLSTGHLGVGVAQSISKKKLFQGGMLPDPQPLFTPDLN